MILEKEDEIIRLNNELNSIKADTKKTLKQFEDFNSLITKLKNAIRIILIRIPQPHIVYIRFLR